ncbi:hypothetical protein JR316_0009213 [Psilocybe cubensis]|uniref:Uncharacterized protein n=2 Tax=Psilocybe cubensis TaxID=181762 RepID=A0A8H8CKG6_PSICU|nr:hypothetical protein JR316_0009213 [Psilocybe cubensis]KAH9478753.1 hypothetical protein JR316_0009213 [Psilocybe cubensis]
MPRWLSSIVDFVQWFGVEPSDKHFLQAKSLHAEYTESGQKDFGTLNLSLANFELALCYRRRGEDGLAHPDLEATLSTYASVLWKRYEITKSLFDLYRVIELDEEAKFYGRRRSTLPPGRLTTPILFRSNITSSQQFQKAVQNYEKLTLETDLRKQRCGFLKLGIAFLAWYERNDAGTPSGERIKRLDKALKYFHQALDLGGNEILPNASEAMDADQKDAILRIAVAYYVRYKDRKDPKNLDAAIDYNRKARSALQVDDKNYAYCSFDLAEQLFTLYQRVSGSKEETRTTIRSRSSLDTEKVNGAKCLEEAREVLEDVLTKRESLEEDLVANCDDLLKVVQRHIDGLSVK